MLSNRCRQDRREPPAGGHKPPGSISGKPLANNKFPSDFVIDSQCAPARWNPPTAKNPARQSALAIHNC